MSFLGTLEDKFLPSEGFVQAVQEAADNASEREKLIGAAVGGVIIAAAVGYAGYKTYQAISRARQGHKVEKILAAAPVQVPAARQS